MATPSAGAASFRARLLTLLGPLGVVFGDIGTSPLYALREASADIPRGVATALGLASTAFWALLIVISVKYTLVILRADHHGEGGIFALLGLLREKNGFATSRRFVVLSFAIVIGAALLYGDGVITPAISVLSAWEGLHLVNPLWNKAVLPLTLLTLGALFAVQSQGTERIGRAFGYVMAVWFAVIAALGVPWILKHPVVFTALDPRVALSFLSGLSWSGYIHVIGAITLCITGGEALYADMGHFSRSSVRMAWTIIVFPALTLNYLGQAARLLEPGEIPHHNLFYALVPSPLLIPVIALATVATIIASQALISGAFSLTNQAMQLQIFPRMAVVYTSPDAKGQIYMPAINRALCIGSIALVLGFQSSSALSGAYGLAVAGTMSVTTIAFAAVAIHVLGWRPLVVLPLTAAFLFVDVQFLVSNMFKFLHGGYVPVLIAFTLTAIMWTWRSGKLQLRSMDMRFRTKLMPWFVEKVRKVQVADGVHRDPRGVFPGIHRAVVFLCSSRVGPTDPVPLVVRLFLKRLGVVPQHTLLLHISQEPIPRVLDNARRYEIHDLGKGILDQRRPPVELPPSARSTPVGRVSRLGAYVSPPMRIFFADEEWPSLPVYTVKSVTARYGYMEQPHVGIILASLLQEHHEDISPEKWIVEVGEEDAQIASNLGFWHRQRAHLFRILLRQATPAHWYFGLGVDRLVQLTISKTVIPIMLERDGARLVLPMVDLAEPTTIVRS